MSQTPLYEMIYEHLKAELYAGKYEAKARFPSRRASAKRFQVSLNTIDQAYQQLVDEGFVKAVERSGFFVLPLPGNILTQALQETPKRAEKAPALSPYHFGFRNVDAERFPYSVFKQLSQRLWESEDPSLLESAPFRGDLKLREALAAFLRQTRAIDCEAAQLIIRPNAQSLFALLLALLRPPLHVGFENPGYHPFVQQLKHEQISYLPVGPQGLELAAVEKAAPSLLVCSPAHQFPTGTVLPIQERSALLSYANAKAERYILEDDYDSSFRYQGLMIPALQSQDPGDKVIYLGNVSKSICPGFRISYLRLPERLLHRLEAQGELGGCPVNRFSQRLLASFLSSGQYGRHLNRMRKHYGKKRELILDEINKGPFPIDVLGSEAGLHLNLRLPPALSQARLRQALEQAQMPLPFLQDFYHGSADAIPPTLLLGFAAIPMAEIPEQMALLWDCMHAAKAI